jgi:hypothetical protein
MSQTPIGGPTPEDVFTVQRHRVPSLSDDDRIVVVVAPAGYGKTTLGMSWHRSNCGADCATWIVVDEAWRDLGYFVRELMRAMNLDRGTAADSIDRETTLEEALNSLVSKLEARPQRTSFQCRSNRGAPDEYFGTTTCRPAVPDRKRRRSPGGYNLPAFQEDIERCRIDDPRRGAGTS